MISVYFLYIVPISSLYPVIKVHVFSMRGVDYDQGNHFYRKLFLNMTSLPQKAYFPCLTILQILQLSSSIIAKYFAKHSNLLKTF